MSGSAVVAQGPDMFTAAAEENQCWAEQPVLYVYVEVAK
jgi:hypothetical protein